jgi:hypothetical protein
MDKEYFKIPYCVALLPSGSGCSAQLFAALTRSFSFSASSAPVNVQAAELKCSTVTKAKDDQPS